MSQLSRAERTLPSSAFLFKPSTDWTRPTTLGRVNFSIQSNSNVNLTQKHSPRRTQQIAGYPMAQSI